MSIKQRVSTTFLALSVVISTCSCNMNKKESNESLVDLDTEIEQMAQGIKDDSKDVIEDVGKSIKDLVVAIENSTEPDTIDISQIEEVTSKLQEDLEDAEEMAAGVVGELSEPTIEEAVQSVVEEVNEVLSEKNFEDIIRAIQRNPHLSNEEKALFLSNPLIFKDNEKYFDIDKLIEVEEKLYTNYGLDQEEDGLYTGESLDFQAKKEDAVNSTLTHEFCHTLTTNNNGYFMSFLIEATNTMFNDEYFGSGRNVYEYDQNIYSSQVAVTKALAEIIGAEPIKEYHSNCNINSIKDALVAIIPDKDMADSFVLAMLEYGRMTMGMIGSDMINFEMLEAKEKLVSYLGTYYEAKFGKSMNQDILMQYYLGDKVEIGANLASVFEGLDPNSSVFMQEVDSKCYFNSSLLNEHNGITFSVPSSLEEYYVSVDVELLISEGADIDFLVESTDDYTYIDGVLKQRAYRPSEERTEYTINDGNRYISENLNR